MILNLNCDLFPMEKRDVRNLNAASTVLRRFVEVHDIGASNMLAGFGEVYVDDGDRYKLFGRVSFNGRMWNALGVEVLP